jgi:hypothetical protein
MRILTHNGKILTNDLYVKDSLVLNLDATDTNSYSGSGITWYDLSGKGNNATLVNGVGYSTNSLVFDGIDDYVSGNDITGLCDKEMFISIFYKLTAQTTYPMLLTFGGSPIKFGVEIRYGVVSELVEVFIPTVNGNSYERLEHYLTFNSNEIIQIGLYVKDNVFKLYKNGEVVASNTNVSPLSFGPTTPLNIGRRFDGFYFTGNIYNVMIYNRALTDIEIKNNYSYYNNKITT